MDLFDSKLNFLNHVSKYVFDNNWHIKVLICTYFLVLLLLLAFYVAKKVFKKFHATYDRANLAHALYKAVLNADVFTAIRVMEQCPEAVNVQFSPNGYTPFLRACLQGNTQLVKIMLEFGADVNVITYKGESAFYLAVYNLIKNPESRNASCIHALYYAGANINAATDKGYNPLQMTAMFGHTTLALWLLSKGCNTNVHPRPYQIARSQGHLRTAEILKPTKQKQIDFT